MSESVVDAQFVLAVMYSGDYDPTPDIHGPFSSLEEARAYAERYRARQELPIKDTPDNNDEWTELGWYFGIFELRTDSDLTRQDNDV